MFGSIEEKDFKPIDFFGHVYTGSTPSMKIEEYYEHNDIPFIKPSDLSENVSFINNVENYIDNRAENSARIFEKDTVLVTCIGIVGKIGISIEKSSCNQQINYIIPYSHTNSIFLAHSISSQKEKMCDIAKDAPIVPIINKSIIELIKQKKITAMKYGNAWLVNLDELYFYFRGNKK